MIKLIQIKLNSNLLQFNWLILSKFNRLSWLKLNWIQIQWIDDDQLINDNEWQLIQSYSLLLSIKKCNQLLILFLSPEWRVLRFYLITSFFVVVANIISVGLLASSVTKKLPNQMSSRTKANRNWSDSV